MSLYLQPITFLEACEFVRLHHRHHKPPIGYKFCIAVNDGEKVVGVAICGRPVSRKLDDGWTVEVNRVATDGTKHAGSMLYGACRRAAAALGYKRLFTYTLPEESGKSLRAAGFDDQRDPVLAGGGAWNCKSRPRIDTAPTQEKLRWEVELNK